MSTLLEVEHNSKVSRNFYWFNIIVTASLISTFILSKFIDISAQDRTFLGNFIEWFGVLYGFLLPLILVRVWEQFDDIDHEFDSEIDAITILTEDLMLVKGNLKFRIGVLCILYYYVKHVRFHYQIEANTEGRKLKEKGNSLLRLIRKRYAKLIYDSGPSHLPESLISELLRQINSIIDIRGDRISKTKERLFETLRSLAYITSLAWLLPFYYVNFELGLPGYVLVFIVTFLIIVIITIIEDLDEPYRGVWAIDITSWGNLYENIGAYIAELREEYKKQVHKKKIQKKKLK